VSVQWVAPNGGGPPGRAGWSRWPWRSGATGVAAAGPWGACCSLVAAVAGVLGGSSPAGGPLAAAGLTCPSPRPVPVRASADHDRGRMMPGGDLVLVLVAERPEPVLGRPAAGVGGVHGDHVEPGVGGHLGEPVPEPAGGQARDHAPPGPAAAAAGRPPAGVFASQVAGGGEVEVLDGDRRAAVGLGDADEGGDGGAEPPVPSGGREVVEVEGDRDRQTGRVPVRVITQAARCPWLRSTASTGRARRSSRDGAGQAGRRQEASRYQRPRAGSRVMS
jgi:hypothetical protein